MSGVRRAKRLGLVSLATLSVLALAGCGNLRPGVAAAVGDETISTTAVDDFAAALCSVNVAQAEQQQQPQEFATRDMRSTAIQVLLDINLSQQFGESEGAVADQAQVAQAMALAKPSLDALPADLRDAFADAVHDYAEAQLMLTDVGRRALEAQGNGPDDASGELALQEGTRLRTEFLLGLDVEVDPRFGSYDKGVLTTGNGSLSVPVSKRATDASVEAPAPTWLAGLPASQKCG